MLKLLTGCVLWSSRDVSFFLCLRWRDVDGSEEEEGEEGGRTALLWYESAVDSELHGS